MLNKVLRYCLYIQLKTRNPNFHRKILKPMRPKFLPVLSLLKDKYNVSESLSFPKWEGDCDDGVGIIPKDRINCVPERGLRIAVVLVVQVLSCFHNRLLWAFRCLGGLVWRYPGISNSRKSPFWRGILAAKKRVDNFGDAGRHLTRSLCSLYENPAFSSLSVHRSAALLHGKPAGFPTLSAVRVSPLQIR